MGGYLMGREGEKLYRLPLLQRVSRIAARHADVELSHVLTLKQADRMSENVFGIYGLPMGYVPRICIDNRDFALGLCTEEASVVAAVCKSAKHFNAHGGVSTTVGRNIVRAQVARWCQAKEGLTLLNNLEKMKSTLHEVAQSAVGRLIRGGRVIEIVLSHYPAREEGGAGCSVDVVEEQGDEDCVTVDIVMDVAQIQGANRATAVALALRSHLNALPQTGESGMAIISNQALTSVTADVVIALKEGNDIGMKQASAVVRASKLAGRSAARAVTHNKGILNGMVALALAMGQDTRGLTSAALSWALRDGVVRPLSCWWLANGDKHLCGRLEVPVSVGRYGGATSHPTTQSLWQMTHIESRAQLCSAIAAVGLASNYAALLAITSEKGLCKM